MAFKAGKWAGLLGPESSPALTGSSSGGYQIAGSRPATSFGFNSAEDIKNFLGQFPEDQRESALQLATLSPLLNASLQQFDPEWRKNELRMQEELATKRGWKSLMFNQLGAGLENLTKGIAMSMNPYGTPEAARYVADMAGQRGAAQAAGYAGVRTPMNIPIVQPGMAPSYF